MIEGNGLPSGWVAARLRDVAARGHTRNPKADGDGDFFYVDIEALDNSSQKIVAPKRIPNLEAPSRARVEIKNEDVLFSLVRPYLKNIARVPEELDGQIASTAYCLVRPEAGVSSSFLFYFLSQESFIDALPTYGNSPPAARDDEFYDMALFVPPATEQRRIVAAIEEQFVRLDAGVSALERARANLIRYRASVLKAAVEGRLTEEWREQNPDAESGSTLLERILEERRTKWEEAQLAKYAGKEQEPPKNWRSKYKEPAAPDIASLPELPDGWVWATLEQLSGASGYGTSQKCGYEASGPPVLRIPNVSRGILDFTDMKYGTKPDELRTTDSLAPNDLLVIRTNGSRSLIGRSALVRHRLERPHYFASYMIRFRILNLTGLSSWLASIWDASPIRAWIENAAATSAGQYNISIGKLNGLEIPLPPLAEQEEIVAEVERRLSVIEEVETQVAADLKRAARLRQSILKRAFEGRLVPQDPDDEPAEALLERIREERERSVAKKTKQKPTKKNAKEVQTSLFSIEGG